MSKFWVVLAVLLQFCYGRKNKVLPWETDTITTVAYNRAEGFLNEFAGNFCAEKDAKK
ncbi:hypothetical protein J6590_075696 [Homalodisca vitripennis]|nr:hypothetical protein J6590_075696 [Homalodisca vitripennis]